jgi:hypothetical protein
MLKDVLGDAAASTDEARKLIKDGELEKAWAKLHEVKNNYLKHAAALNLTHELTLVLDGAVSEDLGDVLRILGKHDLAFAHILYWLVTSSKNTRNQTKKLDAYLSRCRFELIGLDEVNGLIQEQKSRPDFGSIQNRVFEWREIEPQ